MKYRNMLPFVALSVLILTSCDDNKMEWYKDPYTWSGYFFRTAFTVG